MKEDSNNIERTLTLDGLMTFGKLDNGLHIADFQCCQTASIVPLTAQCKVQIMRDGNAVEYSEEKATSILSCNPVRAVIDVKDGNYSATAWGCDLTFDYVRINADYRS